MSNFATRLRIALNQRGIKQSVLAYKCGVDQSTISNYLKGRYEPKNDMLVKLGAALEVEPAWLAGYDVPISYIKGDDKTQTPPPLSEGEQKLLELFKEVPEEQQGMLLEMIEVALKNRK